MKKIALFLIFSFSHFLILQNVAQETFLNDRLTATDDVNGTSRYVAMGGALGALGADLSVISSNPAGMALYRKNDVGLTFGVVAPQKNGWDSGLPRTYNENLTRASFDQMGFVWSIKGGDKLTFVNFSVNYQKKANYNMGFFADNLNLGGLSQMDQVVELANEGYGTDYNLTGMAVDNNYLQQDATNQPYYNTFRGQRSEYTTHQRGSLQAYDFNIAFNLKDRFYTGLTFGVDNVNLVRWSEYSELNQDALGVTGDYALYNDQEIKGSGLNAKLGFIVRPIEENPLRFGLTVETPTRYHLKTSTLYDLTDFNTGNRTNQLESYIETVVRTPWRARFSVGSTVDKILAWGVEYEYANAAKTRMGYPTWDDPNYNTYNNTPDNAMNNHTKQVLRGQHTVKVGIEVKPVDAFAIRLGYNYISSRYKKNASFDQFSINSKAMDFQTSTDYMTLGATNIATIGVGYQIKKFYFDLAYKYRMQNAKFYAFDTGFTGGGSFQTANPTLANASLTPVDVDLNRHQLQLSLGFKF